jgi:hypothetical protein
MKNEMKVDFMSKSCRASFEFYGSRGWKEEPENLARENAVDLTLNFQLFTQRFKHADR